VRDCARKPAYGVLGPSINLAPFPFAAMPFTARTEPFAKNLVPHPDGRGIMEQGKGLSGLITALLGPLMRLEGAP